MHDELAARQRALTLRLAGRPIQAICTAVGRSAVWFHKWCSRYLLAGPEGLYDLTRANHHVAPRLSPELERTILSLRRRLPAHATPAPRYRLTGATAILAELKSLGVRPLPSERALERNGRTAPRFRLAPLLPRQEYPGPQARASNELHEVDLGGPIYRKGSGHRSSIWVGKEVFDGAVCLRLASSRRRDEVLGFRGECWKDLGRPEQVPFGNARERAAGRVTFIRRVRVAGTVTVLSQRFRVGKRHRGLYLRLVGDTGRGWRTAYRNGRVLKRGPSKWFNE